jgi:transmembrane sensor
MEEKEFEILIDKYLNGQLNEEEKNSIELWLRHVTDPKATDFLIELEREERGIRIYKELKDRIKLDKKNSRTALILSMRPLMKIAASLFLCCLLVFAFRTQLKKVFMAEQYASAINSKGQITKTILSDGTIVWLKGKSKLTYPVAFSGSLRNVDLEGEALFEVAKDHLHPFVIHCAGLSTRVLGTSFNIKYNSHKIEINVLTGRVFLSAKNSAAVTLHPYQKAVYSELGKTIAKQTDPVVEVALLTKGTEYNMLFNDARVEDVLQRIGKKFEVQITVKNQGINNNRITADFTDQSLLNTISMMSEAFNLDFLIDGKSVTLADKQNKTK